MRRDGREELLKSLLIFAALALVAAPVAAQQYPTIVGTWHAEDAPEDCGTPHEIQISAMQYAEESMICRFDDVRRDGWQVTWNGSCNDGSSQTKTQVVALEDLGRLTLSFNGNPGWTALRRCNSKPVAATPPAERVPLIYTAHAADTDVAHQYWGDAIEMVASFDPPPVKPVIVQTAEAASYTFAYIEGGMICGMGNHGCPIRIFENGKKVGEFSACEDLATHALAADGSRFYACEDGGQGRPMSSLMQ
jgi:hypothetical protein